MRRLATILLIALANVVCAGQTAPPQPDLQSQAPTKSSAAKTTIVVPVGTTVSLALTSPIWSKTAKAGDSVYATTVFPVAANNQMAIPAGTYVQGQIDTLKKPGLISPHAQFQIHFTQMIFANGYTVQIPGPRNVAIGQPSDQQGSAASATPGAHASDVIAAVGSVYVDISSASDVLLDNGTQIEMILQVPLRLNAASVAAAVRQSNPAQPAPSKSATLCRPVEGTPGTPDTVVPGTPGTPDIVIPGMNGAPDTVIPGTPGTSDTVIPGIPGTPDITCPGPPVVAFDTKVQNYKESFHITAPAQVSGTQLPVGDYQVTWKGTSPATPGTAQVNILRNGQVVVSVQARVVLLNTKSPADTPATRTKSDGSVSLRSLRFAGQTFALYFDQGAA